jgi:hypothetical protein
VPVLIAMSDNGPQMRSQSTKELMAACAIMQRFGRPGTPTDQAWIESLFGHVKTEWPHLQKIHDPGELTLQLDQVRDEYNTTRLHAGIGYVTPDDEQEGRGDGIRQARRDGLAAARQPASTTVEPAETHHDRTSTLAGNENPRTTGLSQTHLTRMADGWAPGSAVRATTGADGWDDARL